MRRRAVRWGLMLGLLAALAWALQGLGGWQAAVAKIWRAGDAGAQTQAPALEFTPAEVVRPQWTTMPQQLAFSGALVAPVNATVRARASGTLAALEVVEGSRVRAGQVIGRIDAAEAVSRAAERAALLESARASLAQAERVHAQSESLAQQRFISASALDSSRAALQAARAQAAAAEAALNTARLSVVDATIAAPVDGLVSKRHALPGEKVNLEQALVSLVDIRELELSGQVALHEVARLAPGMVALVSVEGERTPQPGRIVRIAPAAEPGTRAIAVSVAVPNRSERLRAGQHAVASVESPDATPRLSLPETAVSTSSGASEVWALVGERLQRRAVTLGRHDARSGRVEVLAGLTPETEVLAVRFDNLRDGAAAKVVSARAAPPSAVPPAGAAAAASAPAPALALPAAPAASR